MGLRDGVILPVAYFPPISYFISLVQAGEILIETGETFPKQTYRNRCEIASHSGKQILIVPIHKPHGNRTRTHEVFISPHGEWPKKHWKALETAYSSSPFFIYYADTIRNLIFHSYQGLEEFNLSILDRILEILKMDIPIRVSQGYLKEAGNKLDLRGAFSKKGSIKALLPAYPQVFSERHPFLPDLSILDLLFNLGPDAAVYLQEVQEITA